ncbi:MAG: GNAT family N-acetyltransferase [Rhodovulum sp.]
MVEVADRPASPEDCLALRQAAGVSGFRLASVRAGLANTLLGACLRAGGRLVGMGRVTGDGRCFAQITDIAVAPAFRGGQHGGVIVARLMERCGARMSRGCHVRLLADPRAERLYERAGFASRTGMAQVP